MTSSRTKPRMRSWTVCGPDTWNRRARIRPPSTRALRTSWRCSRSSRYPRSSTYAIDSAVGLPNTPTMRLADLTLESLKHGVLLGLGEQFGEALSGVHGAALRRSVTLKPAKDILKTEEEFQESHRRGEVLVAAMLHAFLAVYRARLDDPRPRHERPPAAARVAEEGADIADRMLTMSIRALDYMPPTDIEFGDY